MKQLHSHTDTLEVVDRKYRFTVMTVIPSIVVTLLITLFPSLNALVSLILLWTFPVAFYLLWNRADNRVIENYTVESTPQWEQVESITVESLINYRSLIDFTESDDEVTILNELYKTNPNLFAPDNSSKYPDASADFLCKACHKKFKIIALNYPLKESTLVYDRTGS